MAKLIMIIVAFFFVTLAVVTAVETMSSPKAPALLETRGERRKKARR